MNHAVYSEIFEVNFVLLYIMVFIINNFLWNNILRNVFLYFHWKYAHMQNLILGNVLQSPSKKGCPTVGPQFAGLTPQLEGTVNLSGIWIFFNHGNRIFVVKLHLVFAIDVNIQYNNVNFYILEVIIRSNPYIIKLKRRSMQHNLIGELG